MLMITQEQKDIVAELLGEALYERFQDKFVFDPIVVVTGSDDWDNEYLRIAVVFDGDQKFLDPAHTIGAQRQVRWALYDQGITQFPVVWYTEKSEWERASRRRKRRKDRYTRVSRRFDSHRQRVGN